MNSMNNLDHLAFFTHNTEFICSLVHIIMTLFGNRLHYLLQMNFNCVREMESAIPLIIDFSVMLSKWNDYYLVIICKVGIL